MHVPRVRERGAYRWVTGVFLVVQVDHEREEADLILVDESKGAGQREFRSRRLNPTWVCRSDHVCRKRVILRSE